MSPAAGLETEFLLLSSLVEMWLLHTCANTRLSCPAPGVQGSKSQDESRLWETWACQGHLSLWQEKEQDQLALLLFLSHKTFFLP